MSTNDVNLGDVNLGDVNPDPVNPIDLNGVVARTMRFGYDRGAWHPTLVQALDGLSAEQAAWKPAPGNNSIHDIVRHLTLWKHMVLDGMDGRGADFAGYAARDWPGTETTEQSWRDDLAALHEVSDTLLERVAALDPHHLGAAPGEGGVPLVWKLLNMATHDAYHAGQIRHLRVLQGA